MGGSWVDLERRSIARALEVWHDVGRNEFIARTKFSESRRYVVIDRGQRIDSKPLLSFAYQLQFNCPVNEVPRLSGGYETRAILKRLGYLLVDLRGEDVEDSEWDTRISIGHSSSFWWANQSKNFDQVYEDRTLWAPLVGREGQQVDHWRSLKEARPGDIVFHYASPELRAVSRIATVPQPAYPPYGYAVPPSTAGTLVLTEPVCSVRVPRETVLEVLEYGRGPMNSDGTMRRGYFFPVAADQALDLLRCANLEPVDEAVPHNVTEQEAREEFFEGASDRLALTAVRAEQGFLRRQQIRKWGNSCCLCRRSLPDELLVAAHIKPRWACTESERMDTLNVAMLACLFGCDALFELGYVTVDESGRIEQGPRRSVRLEDKIREITGELCPAYGEHSQRYFAWHRQHHVSRWGKV